MIDHVSIAVTDLAASASFYERALTPLGLTRLITRPTSVAFGKRYPEFWLNQRAGADVTPDSGAHVCLRARGAAAIEAFHRAALAAGGGDNGAPGLRPDYAPNYYAAFIRDLDRNQIEAVTFLDRDEPTGH